MKFLIIPVICPYVSRGQKPNTMGERTVHIHMDAHPSASVGPQFWREIPPKLTKTESFKNPLFVLKNGQKAVIWARSSAGRAFGSHPKGSGVRSSSGPP